MSSRHLPSLPLAPVLLCILAGAARAGDNIFPPQAAARDAVAFDGRGFTVRGQRTFLVGGTFFYSRVPHELWRDRLLKMKRAGCNAVQLVVFWNYHEPRENEFLFSGDRDLGALLQLVQELGLYAIVQAGPYNGAEWDNGGLPLWLRSRPGLKVREEDPAFLHAVDHWFGKLLPLLATRQIHRGGPVLMLQLENDHPKGSGAELGNAYLRHLYEQARSLGIEVPIYLSGLHRGQEPAGDRAWDTDARPAPWLSTEFWPDWQTHYGLLNKGDLLKWQRAMWRVAALGGAGFSNRLMHGGTDFDATGSDEVAAAYDYSAGIGQAGELRPGYYRAKRFGYFAQSFSDILANASDASDAFRDAATGTNDTITGDRVRVTARTAPAGTVLFLDNAARQPAPVQVRGPDGRLFPSLGELRLAPGDIVPIVEDYLAAPGITLQLAAARPLGLVHQGRTTTLLIYGPPGESAELRFAVRAAPVTWGKGQAGFTWEDGAGGPPSRTLVLRCNLPATGPDEYSFTAAGQTLRVLAMSAHRADAAYLVEAGGQPFIVVGPDYVGDASLAGGRLHLTTAWRAARDQPLFRALDPQGTESPNLDYGPESEPRRLRPLSPPPVPLPSFAAPPLAAWEVQPADAPAQPGYADRDWMASDRPRPLGADGDIGAYGWYRSVVQAPAAGGYALSFSDAGDWLGLFVNGAWQGATPVQRRDDKPLPRALAVTLRQGANVVAVLASHQGRSQLKGYTGPLEGRDVKGISGPVALLRGAYAGQPLTWWRVTDDDRADAAEDEMAGPDLPTDGLEWRDARTGDDVFKDRKGWVWYRTMIEPPPPDPDDPSHTTRHYQLHFENIDDNSIFYLNGVRLTRHDGCCQPFDVPLDDAWRDDGPNALAILVENTGGPGGIMGDAQLQVVAPPGGGHGEVTGWRMQGGDGAAWADARRWQLRGSGYQAAGPAYFRTSFVTVPPRQFGPHPVLRLVTKDLARGFVWLNGHNLGRYPEKEPVDSLYLPECYLRPGRNELMLLDEEGKAPDKVHVMVDEPASRTAVEMEAE